MSEFHDDYPQYELMAHHSEEEGKVKRKKLWNVFWIMLAITILELIIGSFANQMGLLEADRTSTVLLKVIFIGLTIAKAFYIVFSFMHLGHEKKALKYSVLAPYLIFILYLIYIVIAEAVYCGVNKEKMDGLIVKQKIELNAAAAAGHQSAAGEKQESPAHEGTEAHH
ncbi:MAG: cytochrome C oxidase subunit IV family protein [Bacteroidetes bacterium]|nr:cytochrome C oxidase subunit IV family protein [Bacteroidota bacterium]